MPIVTSFPYLGDIITRHGGDNGAMDARIVSGSKAFGALRGCLFASNSVTRAARRVVYEGRRALDHPLRGCESWSLTEVLLGRLRRMHALHVRGMCRVTRKHMYMYVHVAPSHLDV